MLIDGGICRSFSFIGFFCYFSKFGDMAPHDISLSVVRKMILNGYLSRRFSTGAPIGAWKCNFLPFPSNDKPTDETSGQEGSEENYISNNRTFEKQMKALAFY